MSVPQNPPAPGNVAVLQLPVAPTSPPRHALGLPAGSIRAVLTLMVVGLTCVLLLLPSRPNVPPYLIYLLFIGLGHFFAAHSSSIGRVAGQASPLYLPRGFVRLAVMAGLIATVAWGYTHDRAGLEKQLSDSLQGLADQPHLPLVILGTFFAGVVVRSLVGRQRPPIWLQDMEAWVALLGVLGMAIDFLIKVVIQPSLTETTINPQLWEAILAGIVTFYFGERS
jgi:hypothetical protein